MKTVKYTNKCGSSTFNNVANNKNIIKFCKQKTTVLHKQNKIINNILVKNLISIFIFVKNYNKDCALPLCTILAKLIRILIKLPFLARRNFEVFADVYK